MKNFQDLEDMNLLMPIIRKDYLKRCITCNMVRPSLELENCPYCYKNYLFFIKSKEKYSVYENRHN
jgi:hypothetical protein